MKFSAMVHMEGVCDNILATEDNCGLQVKRSNELDEASEFIIIDENSVYGRRRLSIEERNEYARLTNNNDNYQDDITLYPFAHQVGGHRQLLSLDKGTLCKPLVPRELLFYLNVPRELLGFVPAYKGVVQISESSAGNNYLPLVHQPLRSRKSPFALAQNGRPERSSKMVAGKLTRYKSATDCDSCKPFELHVQLRPFSDEKLLKKNLSRDNLLKADYISRPNEKYLLLLENVASKYQLPCILDLKMGTRQHGDDASEEKRHRQMAKCKASTSASLGVRLCGMQVYEVDYGGYLWYDKYSGRKMDERGLKRALREYFSAGSQLNKQIIDEIIERLKALHEAVQRSPAFRFYGTSLLIVHESCQATNATSRPAADVRLIDFAHTICDAQTSSNGGRACSSPSILRSTSAEQLSSLAARSRAAHLKGLDESSHFSEQDSQMQHEEEEQLEQEQEQEQENLQPEAKQVVGFATPCDRMQQHNDTRVNHHHHNRNQINQQNQGQGVSVLDSEPSGQTAAPSAKLPPLGPTKSTPAVATLCCDAQAATRKSLHSTLGADKGLLFGLENLMRLLEGLKSEALACGAARQDELARKPPESSSVIEKK